MSGRLEVDTIFRACAKLVLRLSSENASTCFESSAVALVVATSDLRAASKNKAKAFSAWSIVFSASWHSSAGTSNFGSVMIVPPVSPGSYDADLTMGQGLVLPYRWLGTQFGSRCACIPRRNGLCWQKFD